MTRYVALKGVLALAFGLFLSTGAQAQLFRTYVAPEGVDGNPCTLAAPCRLLPAALATVIDGGEIWMLGSANYNTSPVNINKSVTILAIPGALGSVVAIGGNAIVINTANVKVALRNLVIVPFIGGGGTGGINMTSGDSLTVADCLVANITGGGINVSGVTNLLVTDTTIRGNSGWGLIVQNGAKATITRTTISGNGTTGIYVAGNVASTTTADIADSTFSTNNYGVYVESAASGAIVKVSVRDSQVNRNLNTGITASSATGSTVTVSASDNIISNNSTGILSEAPGARVWASGNTVSGNSTGLQNSAGLLQSTGDNAVRNNTTQFTGGITLVPRT